MRSVFHAPEVAEAQIVDLDVGEVGLHPRCVPACRERTIGLLRTGIGKQERAAIPPGQLTDDAESLARELHSPVRSAGRRYDPETCGKVELVPTRFEEIALPNMSEHEKRDDIFQLRIGAVFDSPFQPVDLLFGQRPLMQVAA